LRKKKLVKAQRLAQHLNELILQTRGTIQVQHELINPEKEFYLPRDVPLARPE
jgi:hypothetical protein